MCHHHSPSKCEEAFPFQSEQVSRAPTLTAVIVTPPAPFTSGLWGETSAASASLYCLVICLYSCVGHKTDFQMSSPRQPGEQDWACLPFPPPRPIPAAPSRLPPSHSKAILLALIFAYFSCNLMLIRFQIPQIRECESNAGSYWVQKSACIYRHFYSIQPLWLQPCTPPLIDRHLMIMKDVSQRTAETAFWVFWIF